MADECYGFYEHDGLRLLAASPLFARLCCVHLQGGVAVVRRPPDHAPVFAGLALPLLTSLGLGLQPWPRNAALSLFAGASLPALRGVAFGLACDPAVVAGVLDELTPDVAPALEFVTHG